MILLGAMVPPGCSSVEPDFNSPEPAARNAAIVQAAAANDLSKERDLVRMLDSDDPTTRMLAISALERMTGTRMGYDYAAPPAQREEAVRRWAERQRREVPDQAGRNQP